MPTAGSYNDAFHSDYNRRRDVEARSRRTRLDGDKTEEYAEETMPAPALNTNGLLNHANVVKGAMKIFRASDNHEYIRGTDWGMTVNRWAGGKWLNYTIPQGTTVLVKYYHEELGVDGHVIFSGGVEVEQRRNLHLSGGLTALDDPTNDRTVLSIGGSGGSGLDAATLEGHAASYFATAAALASGLAGKANTTHTHSAYAAVVHTHSNYATTTLLYDELSNFNTVLQSNIQSAVSDHHAASSTDHDDRYYTESEVNLLLATKSGVSHSHNDLYYTEAEIDAQLDAVEDLLSTQITAGLASIQPGHVIRDEGVARAQRPFLNFVGTGVSVTDSGTQTTVTIPGASGGSGGSAAYRSLVKMGAA